MAIVITSLLRHALTAAGMTGVLADNDLMQAAGALATLGGLAWSLIPKLLAARQ